MKNIFLIRHSNAEEISAQNDDFHRKLTKKGIEKAVVMAEEVRSFYSTRTTFLSSSAPRALQTAEIFADVLGYSVEKIIKRDFLYHYYSFEQLIQYLSGMKPESVWVFGHNPMMADTASKLSTRCYDSFPKCAVAGFSFQSENFEDITINTGKLLFYQKPPK
ncbi:MAG: hypothetical protein CVU05_06985 [Bacteroidetes bacterium HGW-Bacteroidetes-21]|nr:MAG: hypothetical protein CVU05_06985 [Bacteroidetes bacterium HGW-Bacteroidetes-21]